MPKYQKFDIEKLQHQQEQSKFKQILQNILTFIVSLFFTTLIFYLIFVYLIETPQQRLLEDETRKLRQQYELQLRQYKQLEKAVQQLKATDKDIYRVIFEAEPPEEQPLTNFDTLDQLSLKQIIKWNSQDLNNLLKNWSSIAPQYQQLIQFIQNHKDSINYIPSIQPVPNKNLKFVIYGFGRKIDPVYKTPSFHSGIDFAAPGGTPVFATADGIVIEANQRIRGLGLHIKIDHKNGFSTLYAHLSELAVKEGQTVTQGQIIGYVGNTGKALLPHLHYEVQYLNKPINPIYFFFAELSPKQFYKLKKSAEQSGISLD